MDVPTLPLGCPWSGWALPNLKWCEANLCAWVTTPANTWSNLAYLAVALLMRRWAGARPLLRPFAPAAVATGVSSFAYHASYTYFFQFFDFVGMFLFAGLPVTLNAVRLGWISERARRLVYGALVIGCSALVPIFFRNHVPIQAIVALLIAVAISQELILWFGRATPESRGWWLVAVGVLAVAATCSGLDLSRVWCDPENHWLQGHAVWHVLSAVSLLALFRFYAAVSPGRQR